MRRGQRVTSERWPAHRATVTAVHVDGRVDVRVTRANRDHVHRRCDVLAGTTFTPGDEGDRVVVLFLDGDQQDDVVVVDRIGT